MINSVTSYFHVGGQPSTIFTFLTLLLFLMIFNHAVQQVKQGIGVHIGNRLDKQLGHLIYSKLNIVDFSLLEDESFCNLYSRVGSAIGSNIFHILRAWSDILLNGISILGLFVFFQNLDPLLVVGIFVIAFVNIFVTARIIRFQFQFDIDTSTERRKTSYFASLLTSRTEAKEIRLYNAKEYLAARWSEADRACELKKCPCRAESSCFQQHQIWLQEPRFLNSVAPACSSTG